LEHHFTVTGYIVHGSSVVLHWHRKGQLWLPPGGHIERDEDPVTALHREVREETGLSVEVVAPRYDLTFAYPRLLPPPMLMQIADSPEPGPRHEHVDLVYVCRPVNGAALKPESLDGTVLWIDESQLLTNQPLWLPEHDAAVPIPPDVRAVALKAIGFARQMAI
jgi:8-oxo-dGTP pyrophosphatase MutT (NUDIX family)